MEWLAVHWKSILPTSCPSFDTFIRPYVTWPQSSGAGAFGRMRFSTFNAGLLYSAGSIRLLENGGLNVICPPVLHAAETKAVQSPAIIAGVGMNTRVSAGS